MSNLIPVKRTDKNGRMVTRHVKAPGTVAGRSKFPEPKKITEPPVRTPAGAYRELESLGVGILGFKIRKTAILMLLKHDPERLERIIDALRVADKPTRDLWQTTLAGMGDFREMSYERMLANNALTSKLATAIGPDIIRTPYLFDSTNLAIDIEEETGIKPGDHRYNEVQAALIYCAITEPTTFTHSRHDFSFLETNRDDIMAIANNMEKTINKLSKLCKKRDASRQAVLGIKSVGASALGDGAL